MHRTAEYGIASHWRYKEGLSDPESSDEPDEVDEALTWFRQVLDWQKDTSEPEEFMEFLRMDLFQGEIFVFTPKGRSGLCPWAPPLSTSLIRFTPRSGVTVPAPRERAYHSAFARAQERRHRGDHHRPPAAPQPDWLPFVKTARARGRIRQWIRKEERESALKLGKDLFAREIRKTRRDRPSSQQMNDAARNLGLADFDDVLSALSRRGREPHGPHPRPISRRGPA